MEDTIVRRMEAAIMVEAVMVPGNRYHRSDVKMAVEQMVKTLKKQGYATGEPHVVSEPMESDSPRRAR
jgi:hypothetical protein